MKMKMQDPLPIRILTKNIRYATNNPFQGEERWTERRPYLTRELSFNTVHCQESFICLQEVLHNQIEDIWSDLNAADIWGYIGVGRDDGDKAGEYSPIFYRPTVWGLEKWDTVWLSRTPSKPSKDWDAGSIRILTIGVFIHRATKRKVVAMNTHLDDASSRSRLESAKIILSQVKEAQEYKGLPVFLGGDFNSEPGEEAYLEVTGDSSPMADLKHLVPASRQYGDSNTFSGFTEATRRKRIDFIFLGHTTEQGGRGSTWSPTGYAVLPNRFEDGVYNSDHQAVVGDMELV